jgi:hypothetical protein
MCAIISTTVLGSLVMMDPNHGSEGLMGIVMLASHTSTPWAMYSYQR